MIDVVSFLCTSAAEGALWDLEGYLLKTTDKVSDLA